MPFCHPCIHRRARCLRRCERLANGRHLFDVMQDELMRGRKPMEHEPSFEQLPEDVRRAYIAGAEAIREMAR